MITYNWVKSIKGKDEAHSTLYQNFMIHSLEGCASLEKDLSFRNKYMNKLGLGYKTLFSMVGVSFFFSSSVYAWQAKNNQFDRVTLHPSQNTQLAAQFRNYCDPGESVFFFAETKDFWVNICGGDKPYHYVGISKRNIRNSIRLPLNNYSNDGNYFEARNGNVTYEIIRNTAKGSFLLVTQGNKQLVSQPLLYWE